MNAALAKILKKMGISLLSGDGDSLIIKVIKIIAFTFISILLFILMIVAIPIIIIVSIPALIINAIFGGGDGDDLEQKLREHYYATPSVVNEFVIKHIDKKKKEYDDYDSITVENYFYLDWEILMCIDAVRYDQDFSKTSYEDILEVGELFFKEDIKTDTYTVEVVTYEKIKENNKKEVKNEKEEKKENTEDKEDNNNDDVVVIDGVKYKKVVNTETRKSVVITVGTNSFETVFSALGFSDEDKDVAMMMYTTIMEEDFFESKVNLKDLKEYPPGEANIIYFHQKDKRWGEKPYGVSTIAHAGCGPTSLAMVVNSLKDSSIKPEDVANWSYENGHKVPGQNSGSYWTLMTEGAKHYGLNVEAVSRQNPNKIVEALSNCYPVIVSMGRGAFTTTGHFIVLRGLTDDGKILVNDCNSVENTEIAWDIGLIMNQSSTNGGINGSPFWVLKP